MKLLDKILLLGANLYRYYEEAIIFILAEPGMGKTATVAMLAMKYVTGEEGMEKFDFVWTVRLKNVNRTSSLPEILKQQHEQLKSVPIEKIKSILQGKTEKQSKVALLFDGYDEYQSGSNKDIDKALESGVGNSFVVVTSRPGYVGDEIRKKMDFEVTIEGLSVENIKRCSSLYLDNRTKCVDMLKQAKAVGIYHPSGGLFQRIFFPGTMIDHALLRIPIMLQMTCFIFEANHSLPKSRTDILKTLYKLLGDRPGIKQSGQTLKLTDTGADAHEETLFQLGQLAWDALKRDELFLRR